MAFVVLMRLLRESSRMSETRFARDVIGISPAEWSHVVATQARNPGSIFLSALFSAYPWLGELVGQSLGRKLDHLERHELADLLERARPKSRLDPSASNVAPPTLEGLTTEPAPIALTAEAAA